jgi:hypothetical protein
MGVGGKFEIQNSNSETPRMGSIPNSSFLFPHYLRCTRSPVLLQSLSFLFFQYLVPAMSALAMSPFSVS